jgi:hypothetical protein
VRADPRRAAILARHPARPPRDRRRAIAIRRQLRNTRASEWHSRPAKGSPPTWVRHSN